MMKYLLGIIEQQRLQSNRFRTKHHLVLKTLRENENSVEQKNRTVLRKIKLKRLHLVQIFIVFVFEISI